MRPLVTWLLVGALLVLGLLAARDAFQSEGSAAPPPTTEDMIKAEGGPPEIPY